MTDEQILSLRPGDPLVASEISDEVFPEDPDGRPLGVAPARTESRWTEAAINRLRAGIGAPPLPDKDDDA